MILLKSVRFRLVAAVILVVTAVVISASKGDSVFVAGVTAVEEQTRIDT